MHHFKHKHMPEVDRLWVVAVVSNPARYKSRYELFHRFKAGVKTAGANLMVVECALGDRPYEITEDLTVGPDGELHLRLRTNSEIWLKECMINLGVSRLPDDWKYVAWVDADVEFVRHDWVAEAVHVLQHYDIAQMWQHAVDLGPTGEVIQTHDSAVWAWQNGKPLPSKKYGYKHWHPGYAWCARREAFNTLGGLFDVAILGSADHHQFWALLGQVEQYAPPGISEAYRRHLQVWQSRALELRQNIGIMQGTLVHHWHGRKKSRKYDTRWDILLEHNYNPDTDLKKDWQGLYQLSTEGLRLRNAIRSYLHGRCEDGIEV